MSDTIKVYHISPEKSRGFIKKAGCRFHSIPPKELFTDNTVSVDIGLCIQLLQ